LRDEVSHDAPVLPRPPGLLLVQVVKLHCTGRGWIGIGIGIGTARVKTASMAALSQWLPGGRALARAGWNRNIAEDARMRHRPNGTQALRLLVRVMGGMCAERHVTGTTHPCSRMVYGDKHKRVQVRSVTTEV
jgi:hypothetical protein